MTMKMPSVIISFTEAAATAVQRGDRGTVAMILRGAALAKNPTTVYTVADIPASLSDANKAQVRLALAGYVNAPRAVLVYMLPKAAGETEADYSPALAALQKEQFDYLVAPEAATDGVAAELASYVKSERADNRLIKAVLPNTAGDCEGIVNFATATVTDGTATYTTEQYCGRIAGIIAGTPLSMACTYAPLPELTDCTRLTKAERDTAVGAGKLIAWWDGEKVKLGRGVTSLTTTTAEKGGAFQKIKTVECMDIIASDIRRTAEDSYIGKYPNTFANKCLLMNAIRGYLGGIVADGGISGYEVDIDVDANRAYLQGKGVDTSGMSDGDVRTADTGSHVFLAATMSMLDAIEDIELKITI